MTLDALSLAVGILIGFLMGGISIYLASGYEIAALRHAAEAMRKRWRNE